MKKIIIFSNEYFPITNPCSIRMDTIYEELKKDFDVKVLTSIYSQSNNFGHVKSLWTIKLRKKNNIYRLFNNLFLGLSASLYLLLNKEFDVVLTTSPPIISSFIIAVTAKLLKKPFISDIRDIWPDIAVEMNKMKNGGIVFKIFSFMANYLYKNAFFITCVTEGKKLNIASKTKNDIYYISNGIDERISLHKYSESGLIDKNKKSIAYIGNVGLAQNLDVFLTLAVKNPNINFYIIGNGADKKRLLKKSIDLQIGNVKFIENQDHKQILNVYKEIDFSFASLVNSNLQDSVPTKIFESLFLGVPIFLVAEGESEKIVENSGLGIVVSPSSNIDTIDLEFKKFINTIFNNSRKDYSKKYIKENFSRQKSAEKLNEILKCKFYNNDKE